MKDLYILAVETTCDETSIAIVKNGKEVIGDVISSQMDTHAKYGGVVPEIASRMHCESITMVLEETLSQSEMSLEEMDAVAVAYAPGLMGSLLVGIEFAKTISYLYNIPLIKVNHLIGHIYASKLEYDFTYPALCLIVSGGHTELLIMKNDLEFEVLGKTLDDAIGEAYDKVARVLGLQYPGGPNVEKLASGGINSYKLPTVKTSNIYDFSYSGVKSAVMNVVLKAKQKEENINYADLACSFQTIAVKQVIDKVDLALKNTNIKNVIIAGGVSANKYLRKKMEDCSIANGANLLVPSFKYSTDNAAMIGAAAYPLYKNKDFTTLALNGVSHIEF